MADPKTFGLRCELIGHEEDVRAVSHCELGILTASRDKTVKIWHEDHSSRGCGNYVAYKTLVGHTSYVTALAYLSPGQSPSLPRGAVVTGARDPAVGVWDTDKCEPVYMMSGHEYQVTCVGVLEGGVVVSGALDKTLRVWRGGECVRTLEGHEGPVLCLCVLPSGEVLSGSGDTTARLWDASTGECMGVFRGHSDSVRALCVLPGVGVVSGSHDTTCMVWSNQGDVLATLVGHTALVYGVAATADASRIASASEDKTVRVWRPDGACLQTVVHPACVWGVCFLPDGDMATACADSNAYVWTADPDREAGQELSTAFAARVAAAESSGQGEGGASSLPPGIKVEEESALARPGTRNGENRFVRQDGTVMAYAWDQAQSTWECIGEVMAGPRGQAGAARQPKEHNGRTWDYVFDIDVKDGAPPLKLPYNVGEDPYEAADRFMEENQLPLTYRSQIADFILRNAAPASAGPVTGGGADPYTGSRATAPASNATPASSSPPIPFRDVTRFEQAINVPVAMRKMAEFAGTESDAAAALPALERVAAGDEALAAGGAAAGLLATALSQWPTTRLFPALDVLRVGALKSALPADLLDALRAAVDRVGSCRDDGVTPSAMLAARVLCNVCVHDAGRAWVRERAGWVMDALGRFCSATHKGLRSSMSALVLNLAVVGAEGDAAAQVLSGLAELLAPPAASAEEHRPGTIVALVALGTLCANPPARQMARDLGLSDSCDALKRVGDKEIEAMAKRVGDVLSA